MNIAAAVIAVALATGAMDVQHYSLDLHVDPATKSLHGVVETRAKLVANPPTQVALDLSDALLRDADDPVEIVLFSLFAFARLDASVRFART